MAYYAGKLEKALQVVDGLREKSLAGVPVIVEGRRDEEALRKLGVAGRVFRLKGAGVSRITLLERLDGFDTVVLLTDFDREGGELRSWLNRELTYRGVRADDFAWRTIRALARPELRSVEELPVFLQATEARARGERP
jgi:5S rRNA maturation endonuclease (ribonuclease M5)